MVEYGWDQTPTPDLGLDITKAPSDIQKLYKWVIEKTYGEDVASAYGQGLIAAGIIAKNAEAMSLFTSGQMDKLYQFVKDTLIELTEKDVISAPEIIASRDGEDTLSARLDRDLLTINTRMDTLESTNNYVYVDLFGALGDGVTDDTDAFETMVESLKDGDTIILRPGANYILSRSIIINKHNITVDGNFSTLTWNSSLNQPGTALSQSILRFIGELGTTWTTVSDIDTSGNVKVTVNTPGHFSVGEMVYLGVPSGTFDTTGGFLDYKPQIGAMVQILGITDNVIELDHRVPFEIDITSGVNARLTKIYPILNPKVVRLNIHDAIPIEENPDNRSWMVGISFHYALNPVVEDIKVTNWKVKGVRFVNSRNIYGNRLLFDSPRSVVAACGYGIQVAATTKGMLRNVYGVGTRHLIDFSAGTHVYVDVAEDLKSTNTAFDCHGLSEHNITFNKIRGGLVLGNGPSEFPMVTEEILVTGSILTSFANSYSKGLTIRDSHITTLNQRASNTSDITIDNCTLDLVNYGITFAGRPRGGKFKPKISLLNTHIRSYSEAPNGAFGVVINTFDDVRIDNCTIESMYPDLSMASITIEKSNRVLMTNTNIINTIHYLSNSSPNCYFKNINYIVTAPLALSQARRIIAMGGTSSVRHYIVFENVSFKTDNQIPWIRWDATLGIDSVFKFINIKLEGPLTETIITDNISRLKITSSGITNWSDLSTSKFLNLSA